ncbi:hypothetical protein B0T19DRAFT_283018 [Cercophora scortea]|uniref:Secreted protein n=1 Tax=Cercophora scortea TaxID=314031 RepID=A0AAE0I7Y7_9PEZI|nr:hypothetical protein B0T19DRAFT_283018 [Cercophora scortea]
MGAQLSIVTFCVVVLHRAWQAQSARAGSGVVGSPTFSKPLAEDRQPERKRTATADWPTLTGAILRLSPPTQVVVGSCASHDIISTQATCWCSPQTQTISFARGRNASSIMCGLPTPRERSSNCQGARLALVDNSAPVA